MVVSKNSFYFLILAVLAVWAAVFVSPDEKFHLVACDVGEGDAILATYKNFQILTDGGPTNKVLDCLGRHLPFWDKKIEVVILTHPDSDHYRGLIEIFKRYRVENFFSNGQEISTSDFQVLKKLSGGGRKILAGTKIRAGMIQLDILAPEKTSLDGGTNENSIIDLVKFGNFKALLTGDTPFEILENLATTERVNYIKISHHGSKTGTNSLTLTKFSPQVAVISVGKNNYGHPAQEILDLLSGYGLRVFRTDQLGDIEIISDGTTVWTAK